MQKRKKPKDIMLDFAHYIAIGCALFYFIFYVIFGKYIAFISQVILRSLIPLSLFGLAFLIKLKLEKKTWAKKREELGESEETEIVETVELTYFDKLLSDAVTYLLPIVVLVVAIFSYKAVSITDIIQAVVVFLTLYFWHKYLFKRRS